MPNAPSSLLLIIEAAATTSTTRLQLGPQCCCVATITCSGMEWPETFGVEFHGSVSDPGGDNFCDDHMQRFGNTPTDLRYSYAVELTDFFGIPIEVQYHGDLPACTWCPPTTADYTQEVSDPTYTIHNDCTYVSPTCKGLVELGSHHYGFQNIVATAAAVHSACVVECDNLYVVDYTFRLENYPFLMDGLQVAITVAGGGTTVDVSFSTALLQAFIETQITTDCSSVVTKDLWSCETPLNIVPLSGVFSRTFPAGAGWNDIKDEQIPGTITAYNQSGSACAFLDGGGVISSVSTCVVGTPETPSYSCVGDYTLPRLAVADAYCILREL